MRCEVPGCKNESGMIYMVDPAKPKAVCHPCYGKWTPLTLDTLLNVKQENYGAEEGEVRRGKGRNA